MQDWNQRRASDAHDQSRPPGQYDMAGRLRALFRRLCAVSGKEKARLLVKACLRLFGVRKCLFLGGYYEEEDILQRQGDEQIYLKLLSEKGRPGKEEKTGNIGSKRGEKALPEEYQESNAVSEIKRLCKESGYLALAAESLDKGGLEEVVRLLALELRGRGIPIKIFCMEDGGAIADDLSRMGVETLVFHGDKNALEEYLAAHRPLLINTHYVADGFEIFRKLDIPVIEVIHNMYVFLGKEGMDRERSKSQYVTHYIAVSKKAKEIYLQKLPQVMPGKITVIGNALSGSKRAVHSREEVRASLGIARETLVCLAAGSIDPRKNQIGILRAWDIAVRLIQGPAVLILAGAGTDREYERKVRQILKERDLSGSVIMTGYYEQVYDLMNAADVFVLDSYYEGWSMAATEALCCGLPIIHSDCGSGEELTAGGKNGILTDNPLQDIGACGNEELFDRMRAGINGNIEQTAEAMAEMAAQRESWSRRREEIGSRAREELAASVMCRRYLETYLKCCRDHKT